ncbi:hypothetical protein WJ41_35190 [Burkholderia ubonensis]|uniref:hypothetical protein n=1 Tax=Burkholderia ubonensis TaxID=101571 RepID=UPI00075AD2C7|nr:hypothetical protein [Burkholderia ubonensis]KVH78757.1 hypothetical protein WJ41_35190 [Burkholderia ubonensis]KVT98647.1 hypothetical protein WK61_09465 [Burkholderia ubonensis]
MNKFVKLDERRFRIKILHAAKYGALTDNGSEEVAIPLGDHFAELVRGAFAGGDVATYIRIVGAHLATGGDLWLSVENHQELAAFPEVPVGDPLVVIGEAEA